MSLANKLAIIAILIAVITLFYSILSDQKKEESIKQSSSGDRSPVINTNKNVDIRY
jgi:hypothetical protein